MIQLGKKKAQDFMAELLSVYADLCQTHDRLLHYIGLLDPRQQSVVRKYYFESCTWSEIADALKITTRTAQRIRQQAVEELANMYSFADNVFRR